MQARSLPPLAAVAEEVARSVQGSSRLLYQGDYPSAAIAFGGRHSLLIRDHGHCLSLSLPLAGSWSVQTDRDLRAVEPMIRQALAHTSQPFSMADAALVLLPLLGQLMNRAPSLSFPGTPVPQEAWMSAGGRSVGLFQRGSGVMIVVWVGSAMQTRHIATPTDGPALAPWLAQALEEQRLAQESEEAEKQRKAALPLPDYHEVVALLRSGVRIVAGGGRYSTEFYWDARLRSIVFDEGLTTECDASEEDLRAQIRYHPEPFREALAKK